MAALVEEIVSRMDRRSRRETPLPAPQAPSESATGRKPPPSPLVPLQGPLGSKPLYSTRFSARQRAMEGSSVQSPALGPNGPPPTLCLKGLKVPGLLNSTVVPRASHPQAQLGNHYIGSFPSSYVPFDEAPGGGLSVQGLRVGRLYGAGRLLFFRPARGWGQTRVGFPT